MAQREEDFKRSEYYKSWETWLETTERHEEEGRSEDKGAYLPDPVEVEIRIARLKELQRLGFNDRFICSVMQHDTPTMRKVRQMVARYGVSETYRRCKPFLAPTEYDKEID